jgi:hypothetical protein
VEGLEAVMRKEEIEAFGGAKLAPEVRRKEAWRGEK